MLDADSVIAPGFFDACERRSGGRASTQPRRAARAARGSDAGHGGLARRVRAAGDHAPARPRPAGDVGPPARDGDGRSAVGSRSPIASGSGLRGPLLHPRPAARRGPLPPRRHRPAAIGRAPVAGATFGGQKVALRGRADGRGAGSICRRCCAALRRDRDGAALEAAWFLATPPLALAALSLLAGLAARRGRPEWPLAATLSAAEACWRWHAGHRHSGLVQARAGPRTWLALLAAPWYLGWKAGRPAARARERAAARRLLPADRAGLRAPLAIVGSVNALSRHWLGREAEPANT